MRKTIFARKAAIGILSILPLAWVIVLVYTFLIDPFFRSATSLPLANRIGFNLVRAGLVTMVPLVIALTIYYIYVFVKIKISDTLKFMWVILLLGWFPLTAPLVWYLYIWRGPSESTPNIT